MTLYGTGRALLTRRRRFVDTFDALLSRWQTVAGTLAVESGALKASALGDWGNNLITNGEFTTNTDGWAATSVAITRVDSASDPGAASGGADAWCGKVQRTATAANTRARQSPTALVGATYRGSALVYDPSANGGIRSRVSLQGTVGTAGSGDTPTTRDVWEQCSVSVLYVDTLEYRLYVGQEGGGTGSEIGYFDSAVCYRQNAAAIRNVAPAFRARLSHVSPAAPSVVPAGWMFRYTDALNYWELRLLPNTAGNDLQIVQVTAGVGTVRAEADIDWTDGGTDEVELIVRGSTITTRYKKSGGAWTAGPSYASATQGAQARAMGPLVYGTTTARWARAEVDW